MTFNARTTLVYSLVVPVFVNVTTVPGNPTKLIGLKDDGSFWRATAGETPLVWEAV